MRRPSAIAWGDEQLFSTCGEALTDNYEDDATPYAGPALWSSDPSIFGVEPLPEQNGTHLDLLTDAFGIRSQISAIFASQLPST